MVSDNDFHALKSICGCLADKGSTFHSTPLHQVQWRKHCELSTKLARDPMHSLVVFGIPHSALAHDPVRTEEQHSVFQDGSGGRKQ